MAFKKASPVNHEHHEESNVVDRPFEQLVKIVKEAYETGVTMEEAERHAARFLEAQLSVAAELARLDLDTRMRKNGMKAARAKVYLDIVNAAEKKPTETYIDSQVTLDHNVCAVQDLYEKSDARKESLALYFGIFKDAHVYFRGIAKGRFE
jgi:hypothetical protein